MLRGIVVFLFVSGGMLMFSSAIRYRRLIGKTGEAIFSKIGFSLKIAVYFTLWCSVVVYAAGTVHSIHQHPASISLYAGVLPFMGALFISAAVHIHIRITAALNNKNRDLQRALDDIETVNRDLQTDVKERAGEILQQDKLLHTLNKLASILLASESEVFEKSLHECMGIMANSINVDWMYIWKNYSKDGKRFCTKAYNWPASPEDCFAQRTIHNPVHDISYDKDIPGWEVLFTEGLSINGPVRHFHPPARDKLMAHNIISILIVPVFLQNEFWGFMEFDDRRKERIFSATEDGFLRSGGLLIANAMLRDNIQQNLIQAREEALSSAEAKSVFLANMSHEIRTPINAVIGMTTIARRTDDREKIADCLHKIDAASHQLLALVNDILDMSKIEAHKMELAGENFSLIAAMEKIKNIIEVKSAEKKQRLIFDIAQNAPDAVIGDEVRLSQIVLNLLSNAVKFTPEGGTINVSLKRINSNAAYEELEIAVRDTGIGIAADQIDRLFNIFEQADSGTFRRFGGTGLGLPISKRLAELMDGGIRVKSEIGKGSCFTLYFRMKPGDIKALEKGDDETGTAIYDFSGRTALLAEDIEINREIVLGLFEDSGLEIACAENGRAALDRFRENPGHYDIIFMDVQMPVMDGCEATRQIRTLEAKRFEGLEFAAQTPQRRIPIIAMTANAFSEDVERCLQAGMNDHIAKPIDIKVLMAKTAKYLSL
ncbi:hypothetical protein AGMMS49546_07410 [Spirochaetia bacterium]|nr:hypothetical protein AGMMS49546_07410 [Spirochaetia bacterium]